MIRLGRFDKQGYKDSFSKSELARELVYMNNDYDKLEKENQKYKEIINKIKKICDSIPDTNSICEIEKIHEIENNLKEVNDGKN